MRLKTGGKSQAAYPKSRRRLNLQQQALSEIGPTSLLVMGFR